MTKLRDAELEALLDAARPPGHPTAGEEFAARGGFDGTSSGPLADERAAFYAARPFPAFDAAVQRRRGATAAQKPPTLHRRRGASPRSTWALGGLLAACLGAFLLWPRSSIEPPRRTIGERAISILSGAESLRVKGTVRMGEAARGQLEGSIAIPPSNEASLMVHVASPGGQDVMIQDGAVLSAGAVLRFSYTARGWTHLAVVSVDGQGKVTPFYPDEEKPSLAIAPGQGIALPGGVELDDYVGREAILGVFSREPVSAEAMRTAIQTAWQQARAIGGDIHELGELPLAIPHHVRSIAFEKRPNEAP